MIKDLSEKLDQYYALSKSEQDDLLETILYRANNDPEQFIQMVHDEPLDQANDLDIIYETLSKDLGRWSDFFLDETKRVFSAARNVAKPATILQNLHEFAYLDPDRFAHRAAVVNFLTIELENTNPTFRYYAINLLPEFANKWDDHAIKKMKNLLADPDWRIRYWTYLALKDLEKLDNNYKLSFWDRLRIKFLSTTAFE